MDDGSTSVGPCETADATVEPIPPNIMLVLDQSGSMTSSSWDHDQDGGTADITRWNSLYNVVEFIVTNFDDRINFGANMFPGVGGNSCDVSGDPEVPVAIMNGTTILNSIPGPLDDTNGGTPTKAGIVTAVNHLKGLMSTAPAAMLLVTDGAANCGLGNTVTSYNTYDDDLHVQVAAAFNDDEIPTYVVGIDISTQNTGTSQQDGTPDNIVPYDKMNEVAIAGGRPLPGSEKFYQTSNEQELQDALTSIINDALSCTVSLDPTPNFPDLVKVLIDGDEVPKVTDCATENGWVYTNPAGPFDAIELCGTACDDLKSFGTAKIEYYCVPE